MPKAVSIGIASIRANRKPLVIIWSVAAALIALYGLLPSVRTALVRVENLAQDCGFPGEFATMFFFNGIVPGMFYLTIRGIRPKRPVLTAVLQGCWCGLLGMVCARWFQLQDVMYGPGNDFLTLLKKTCTDQFVFSPVVLAPLNAVFSFWLGRDQSLSRVRRDWPANFILELVLPNLLMNWAIGIPSNFALYFMPAPLRVATMGLIGAIWMLLSLEIGRRSVVLEVK